MVPSVTVCICTFKRPALLKRALEAVAAQRNSGRFVFSVVVADNDRRESAREVVARVRHASSMDLSYCVEPEQNIALARNKALANARGTFVAFIDDDEIPAPDWLETMLKVCDTYGAHGVLGPVRPLFDQRPPAWLVRSGLCERQEHKTGVWLDWGQTRTGNVLFRREILDGMTMPFRAEFGNGGEDQDFFRRLMARGCRFVWGNEGIVYEVVPPERCTRRYFLERALLRGQNEKLLLSGRSVAKSVVAVPLYGVFIPFASILGQHAFMKYAVRLLDHIGKLLVALGVKPVRGYLNSY
jgi:succinoglycan biosynthesis protein ExoM